MDTETNTTNASSGILPISKFFTDKGMDESMIGNANTLMMQGTTGRLSASQNQT